MNLHDAAHITRPLSIPERPLDPPDYGWWSKSDEAHYQQERERLIVEYVAAHETVIDAWCRDRHIDETESHDDAAYDASKERDA